MGNKKDNAISNLCNYVSLTAVIECSKCSRTQSAYDMDDYNSAEGFYNMGWRVVDTEPVCPHCVKAK